MRKNLPWIWPVFEAEIFRRTRFLITLRELVGSVTFIGEKLFYIVVALIGL